MLVDLRNNKKALCPFCPWSLRCVAAGLEPLSIRIEAFDAAKLVSLAKEHRYMWGATKFEVNCEPHRGFDKPGWRPKAVTFNLSREELFGKEADNVR